MTPTPTSPFVSNDKTPAPAQQPRAGGVLAARLREKGWSIRDAADYLGVSRQRLYAVFADPARARLWECAIAGMPACTPHIAQALKAARKKAAKPAQAKAQEAPPEFEIGDVVVATKHAGIAEEGEEGVIAGLRGVQSSLTILVRMAGGEDWFAVSDFHAFFATNGKSCRATAV